MNGAGSARNKTGGLEIQTPREVAAAFPPAATAAASALPQPASAVADSIDLRQDSDGVDGGAGSSHLGLGPLPVHSSAAHGAGAEAGPGGSAAASGQQSDDGDVGGGVEGLDLGRPLLSYADTTVALDAAAERAVSSAVEGKGWAKVDNSSWVRMGSDKTTAGGNEQFGRAMPILLAQMVKLTALLPRDRFVDVGSGCGQVSSAILRRRGRSSFLFHCSLLSLALTAFFPL